MSADSLHRTRVLLFTALIWPAGVLAQPDAGQSIREVETRPTPLQPADPPVLSVPPTAPTPPTDPQAAAPRVTVRAFVIEGNTVIDTGTLQAALADLHGRALDLADLQTAAARVTRIYREAGYLLARAWLPQQEVVDGTIRIQVVEGRVDTVRIDNRSRLSDAALARSLRAVVPGEVARAATLESTLLRLNDVPGVVVQSRLRAAAQAGGSDLDVQVDAGPRYEGGLSLDNHGNTYNGAWRLHGDLGINNPLGIGDRLTLRAMHSDESQRYLRAQYDVWTGPYGTRLGVAGSWLDYELGEEFAALDATGAASIATAYVHHAWVRRRDHGFSTQLSYDRKSLRDDHGLLDSRKRLDNFTLLTSGYWRDGFGGGGVTSVLLGWTVGELELRSFDAQVQNLLLDSAGHFQKWTPALQRQQRLGHGLVLAVEARAQFASRNLDSSEKFGLGGAGGVRAYPEGEANGDEGWLASAELRWLPAPGWQTGVFVDAGGVTISRKPLAVGDNHRQLQGGGIAGEWQSPRHWLARLSLAWPLGSERATSDTPREVYVWGQLGYRF